MRKVKNENVFTVDREIKLETGIILEIGDKIQLVKEDVYKKDIIKYGPVMFKEKINNRIDNSYRTSKEYINQLHLDKLFREDLINNKEMSLYPMHRNSYLTRFNDINISFATLSLEGSDIYAYFNIVGDFDELSKEGKINILESFSDEMEYGWGDSTSDSPFHNISYNGDYENEEESISYFYCEFRPSCLDRKVKAILVSED